MGVVVTANVKGGSGKSTTTENLAVCAAKEGFKVVIIDTDPAGDISEWAEDRATAGVDPAIYCVSASGDDVMPLIDDLDEDYDIILVDVGGADSEAMRFSMAKAHKVYIPIEPQEKSIKKLAMMNKMVKNARSLNTNLEAVVFVNRANPNIKVTSAEKAIEIASSAPDLKVSPVIIYERTIIKTASEQGLGVIEHPQINRTSSGVAAKRAYNELFKEVFNR